MVVLAPLYFEFRHSMKIFHLATLGAPIVTCSIHKAYIKVLVLIQQSHFALTIVLR